MGRSKKRKVGDSGQPPPKSSRTFNGTIDLNRTRTRSGMRHNRAGLSKPTPLIPDPRNSRDYLPDATLKPGWESSRDYLPDPTLKPGWESSRDYVPDGTLKPGCESSRNYVCPRRNIKTWLGVKPRLCPRRNIKTWLESSRDYAPDGILKPGWELSRDYLPTGTPLTSELKNAHSGLPLIPKRKNRTRGSGYSNG
uniref:uncharacterized protein LOC122600658 n=1 Tax=Erigeron canadensis TaxID=72917 RepID=UPI001CB88DCB|nr:uncharacterized protein LOC122600658 [Erigeron canadensis]